MRFATVNGHEVNVDNVDEVASQWCGACGWHYEIFLLMSGGNKIIVDDVNWHPEWWGEFEPSNRQRMELGFTCIREQIAKVKLQLAEGFVR